MLRRACHYFTTQEKLLWCASVGAILLSFFLLEDTQYLTLTASLIGVTSLLFNAKGNPMGQALTVVFSLIYGYISYACAYYGEMITYLGMTAPMALLALISWLRHPFRGNRAQVQVNRISRREHVFMWLLTAAVTAGFYFILRALGTANLLPSTVSVITSFLAVYLTFRRSPLYALGYAANDVVLIVLWLLAARADRGYLSVVVCFAAFLANDLYGFINWRRMEKMQTQACQKSA